MSTNYKATIRFFDTLRGEGLVRLESGESIYIDRSVILPRDRRFELSESATEWLDDHIYDGMQCYVKVIRDSHYTAVAWFLPAEPSECWNYLEAL